MLYIRNEIWRQPLTIDFELTITRIYMNVWDVIMWINLGPRLFLYIGIENEGNKSCKENAVKFPLQLAIIPLLSRPISITLQLLNASKNAIDPFQANMSFLYPLKPSKNHRRNNALPELKATFNLSFLRSYYKLWSISKPRKTQRYNPEQLWI